MTNLNEKLENLRVAYIGAKLDVENCNPDPKQQFDLWLDNAINANCDEPNAFVLSTVAASGRPRARVVLLKGIHNGQFIFYTNYKSAKGEEILNNQRVAMTFLWLPLHRQVRIEGVVSKVDAKTSEAYFQKRPRGSQLGAIASPQSQKVSSAADLEKMFLETEEKYGPSEVVPCPSHWGGYAITPDYYEFWQGRDNRMHDRICFELESSGWTRFRLAP
jgi:pyridoxamine 5'-phosphate oxidase